MRVVEVERFQVGFYAFCAVFILVGCRQDEVFTKDPPVPVPTSEPSIVVSRVVAGTHTVASVAPKVMSAEPGPRLAAGKVTHLERHVAGSVMVTQRKTVAMYGFANCAAARAAGAAPLHRGQPGYAEKLDRDGDGIACE